ncbi:MAG TPA: carboxypeptidase regulatory-like domain-containing protein, partial [Bryobacteraceae bacterium]
MRFLRAVFLTSILAGCAWSQVDTGTIVGVVKDSSGALVAGASITIRNLGAGTEHKVPTNATGEYISGPLPPADYQLTAQATGFRETVTRLTLALNQRAVVDLSLEVGPSEQQVNVTSEASLVQTETSTVDNVRTEQAVKDLPLNGRNFTELIGLAAGVMPAQTQTGSLAATAVRGSVANSVNGMGFRANQFLIDGLDNTEDHNGQGVILNPPVEAIQEFSVETSVPPAEFGRGGGNINVRIRSGTRDLHGAAFEFLRNSALDAKNFFDPPGQITPFRMNQFGFALGGPV